MTPTVTGTETEGTLNFFSYDQVQELNKFKPIPYLKCKKNSYTSHICNYPINLSFSMFCVCMFVHNNKKKKNFKPLGLISLLSARVETRFQ